MEEGSFLLWPSPALCDVRQRTGTVVVTGTRGQGAEASDGEKRSSLILKRVLSPDHAWPFCIFRPHLLVPLGHVLSYLTRMPESYT